MSFEVAADAYGQFMGRFAEPLAREFADRASLLPGQRALDVGCGPGALTAELVARLGASQVTAVEPVEGFVTATRKRLPGVDIRCAPAEVLPFADDTFEAALAQLVVHFMSDPVKGLGEMVRVVRPGGLVGACVWDNAGDTGPLSLFWRAVHDLDPAARDESGLAGSREGHLVELFEQAGLCEVTPDVLTVHLEMASFDDWWSPYLLGVGPAGDYVAQLADAGREALRVRCAELLPSGAFTFSASAWAAFGRVA